MSEGKTRIQIVSSPVLVIFSKVFYLSSLLSCSDGCLPLQDPLCKCKCLTYHIDYIIAFWTRLVINTKKIFAKLIIYKSKLNCWDMFSYHSRQVICITSNNAHLGFMMHISSWNCALDKGIRCVGKGVPSLDVVSFVNSYNQSFRFFIL